MMRHARPLTMIALVGAAMAASAWVSPTRNRLAIQFVAHPIDSGLTGGYQVIVADMNHDGKPDILAIATGMSRVQWYENPGWQRHVIATGLTAPINAAVADLDGDGTPEVALAHAFSTVYKSSVGIVSILTHAADLNAPWSRRDIDSVPTSHRVRFADFDASGRPVLINAPLIGPQSLAPEYRDHVPILMYRPGAWKREVITNDEQGVVHGILPAVLDGGPRESLLSASFLGVFAHRYENGQWTRSQLVAGDPSAWPKSGSSDVIVGRMTGERFLATIEPWHGNNVVVYRLRNGAWIRHVIDEAIADGHTIVVGDFDGDGRDEIVVGERAGKKSVYLYALTNAATDTWSKRTIDDGTMAAAGCAVADLNSDRKPDVVCIGTATANLKWYENR